MTATTEQAPARSTTIGVTCGECGAHLGDVTKAFSPESRALFLAHRTDGTCEALR